MTPMATIRFTARASKEIIFWSAAVFSLLEEHIETASRRWPRGVLLRGPTHLTLRKDTLQLSNVQLVKLVPYLRNEKGGVSANDSTRLDNSKAVRCDTNGSPGHIIMTQVRRSASSDARERLRPSRRKENTCRVPGDTQVTQRTRLSRKHDSGYDAIRLRCNTTA